MRRLDRSRWIAGLADGSVRIDVVVGSYGAFGDDWRHRRRSLDVNVLYGVTEGTIRIGLDRSDLLAGPGSVFWLSAGTTHSLELAPGCRRMASWHARVETRDARGAAVRLEDECLHARSPEALSLVGALLRECAGESEWAAERTQATAVLLFTRMLAAAATPAGGLNATQEAAIARALMRDPTARQLRPRDLAAAAGLSPIYFARRFAAHYGCSPGRWLVAQRMRRAAALLLERPDATIGDIAAECGFRDQAPFSRLFHREIGCSPSAFRARPRRRR